MSEISTERLIAENLSRYRRLNGLTQNELADLIGYSNKSVSKWERAEGLPDIAVLIKLSDIFGITVSEFIGQTEPCKETREKIKSYEKDIKAREKIKKKTLERARKRMKKAKA